MRRNYLPKPELQTKYVIIAALLMLVVANLTSGLIYAFLSGAPGTGILLETFGVRDSNRLLPVILISQIVSVIFIGIMTVLATHNTAGPIFNMERVAVHAADGDLTRRIKLRRKDELKDFADHMNRMLDRLDSSISTLEIKTADLEKELRSLDDTVDSRHKQRIMSHLAELRSAISGFRTTATATVKQQDVQHG